MRAALIDKPYSIRFSDVEEPQIKDPFDVKVRVILSGICGSEVHAFHGKHPYRLPPLVSGHEFSGIVAEVGAKVALYKPGDRVIGEPQYGCGQCSYCMNGNYNICPDKKVLGASYWSGSFGEYVVLPEKTLLHLPDGVSFEQGVLVEPVAVGMHAVLDNGLTAGMSCCIIGCGPIGLGVLNSASLVGCSAVYITDVKEPNLFLARQYGCKRAINTSIENLEEVINEETQGQGVDVCFLAFGSSSAFESAYNITKRGGSISQIALIGHPITVNHELVQSKELCVRGSNMYTKNDFRIVLEAITNGKLQLESLISVIYPIEEVEEAFHTINEQKTPIIKALLSF